MTSQGAPDHDPADPTRTTAPADETQPVGEVVDGELLDADVVETPSPTSTSPASTSPAYTTISSPTHIDPDYSEQGVPSFDFVRDKIEKRISTAIGSQELAEGTPEGQGVDDMMRKRDEAAKKKLEEIRKSMGS
ncbi:MULTISPECIES: hypothetical protein [Gordonia]|uniref:hypothetical protein n=1 Tax=Gordonia TaxID=2053 RepID=UPI0007EC19AC|nr:MULTISPECIES: hypothetical protein [Gordonia]MCM3897412.1 hypothetical protein [Gordonia sputi]OBA63432.1 hypothetical protein A5777_23040 [Gordonia sp. 852002-10350_SCH5691597]